MLSLFPTRPPRWSIPELALFYFCVAGFTPILTTRIAMARPRCSDHYAPTTVKPRPMTKGGTHRQGAFSAGGQAQGAGSGVQQGRPVHALRRCRWSRRDGAEPHVLGTDGQESGRGAHRFGLNGVRIGWVGGWMDAFHNFVFRGYRRCAGVSAPGRPVFKHFRSKNVLELSHERYKLRGEQNA